MKKPSRYLVKPDIRVIYGLLCLYDALTVALSLCQLADPALVESLRGEMRAVRGEAERLRSQLVLAEEDLQKEKERLASSQIELNTVSSEREALEEANTRLKDKLARLEVN